ncbi:MAG: citrate lyase holo-[acyl-carrier protein] synthase [Clostridia bacterium]|nr:citrate lyase holo-[acyl-carrier protein] synthase [Clostridia bacterium]
MRNYEVTLDELLQSRDDRQAEQKSFIQKYGCPVISLTVMAAGRVKRTESTRLIGRIAAEAIENAFKPFINGSVIRDKQTGFEAIYSVEGDAEDIKEKTCRLEEEHFLGRFMDIDVIGTDGIPLSRENVGRTPRQCVVCGKVARECVVSRSHSAEEVNAVVDRRVKEYIQSRKGD